MIWLTKVLHSHRINQNTDLNYVINLTNFYYSLCARNCVKDVIGLLSFVDPNYL